jgi:LytS/YehU family sensor histidine kinase
MTLLEQSSVVPFLIEIIFRNTLLAVVIYLNLLYIIPRFVERKNYITSSILIAVSLLGYAFMKNVQDVYASSSSVNHLVFFDNTFYNLSIVTFYYIFAMALYLSKEWYSQQELIRKIEVEKLNTELEYLKAQLNPHFLFNSINTIFFQIDKQNITARETLSKFSDMLRYQLYECNGHEIPVEKEVTYLKNYVELQRLRKDEAYDIQFICTEDFSNFTLPPLLLLPFVENAFKHISHFSDKKNSIKIELSKTGGLFRLSVFNTKDNSHQVSKNGGIGLKNVKRRLDLLFRDRYILDIQELPESFIVNLELKLNETQLSDN